MGTNVTITASIAEALYCTHRILFGDIEWFKANSTHENPGIRMNHFKKLHQLFRIIGDNLWDEEVRTVHNTPRIQKYTGSDFFDTANGGKLREVEVFLQHKPIEQRIKEEGYDEDLYEYTGELLLSGSVKFLMRDYAGRENLQWNVLSFSWCITKHHNTKKEPACFEGIFEF